MTPTHTRKRGKLYRYYLLTNACQGTEASPVHRISASQIETAVFAQIRKLILSPEIVVATWRAAKETMEGLTEKEVRSSLKAFDGLWAEFFPTEQARIVRLLVVRVEIGANGASVTLRTEGLTGLLHDLRAGVVAEDKEAA